jgi:hypothetical protein
MCNLEIIIIIVYFPTCFKFGINICVTKFCNLDYLISCKIPAKFILIRQFPFWLNTSKI